MKYISITAALLMNCIILQTNGFAQLKFIDSGQTIGNSTSNSVALGDIDRDGDLDAVVANGAYNSDQDVEIWINNGIGVFTKSSQQLNHGKNQDVSLADLNGDDNIDIFICAGFGNSNKVFFNDGHGNFTDIGQRLGNVNCSAACLTDLDGDKDIDAFICVHPLWENGQSVKFGNEVWINDGKGSFTNTGQKLGLGYNTGATIGDVDGDGDIDAATASNFQHVGNKIWLNDGYGNFSVSSQALSTQNSMDLSFGDLDNDGDLDAFVIYFDSDFPFYCGVWFNDSKGNFNEGEQKFGKTPSTSVCLFDVDKDGDLDAFVTGGKYLEKRNSYIWLNNGKGIFTDSLAIGYDESWDSKLGDLDADGDVDIFIANNGANKVYLNISDQDSSTTVGKNEKIPDCFQLNQNYPNPFNPSTVISYQLSASYNVKLKIYDSLGQEIKTLVNSFQSPGEHSIVWNGKDGNNNPVSSGIYFYSLQAGNASFQKKMILIR